MTDQTPTVQHSMRNPHHESGEPDVYTVEEVAQRLRIGRGACYLAVRRGEIPAIRLGRRVVVSRRALERLLNGENDGPSA